MSIPKRIIQTHKNADIHVEHRRTWIAHNPEFEYLFFDDAGCERFIGQHFPEFLPTYDKLPLKAQKADFFRYLAIYRLGGIYADVDTICMAPVAGYLDLESVDLAIGIEMTADVYRQGPRKYLQEYLAPRQFSQWTFAAAAGHPMLAALMQSIHQSVAQLSQARLVELSGLPRFVLELTGPIAFTQAVQFYTAFHPSQAIQVLPQLYWGYSPWHNTGVNPRQNGDVKLVHLFHGSWRKPNP